MTAFWVTFLEWFASISALVAVVLTLTQMHGNRTHHASLHYIGHCDVALCEPQFSNPELGKLDMRDRTFNGEKTEFERYEWYVARLVYSLDAAMRIAPFQRWGAVARTQLANHKQYFASDYYAKQGYLKHYSPQMRRLIKKQGTA
ncbi:MAG TPA: hypothetical protein VJS85_03440 [Rhizomicrobium sp.]|nr:hypothetical protein [Rhizomicrobium sp.]